MRPALRAALAAAALLALAASPLFGDVDLDTLVSSTKATLEWEPLLDYGVLTSGSNTVVFKPGMSWALLNYREKLATGEIRRAADGRILFADAGAAEIESAFARPPESGAAAAAQAAPEAAASTVATRIAAVVIDPGHGGKDPGTSHTHLIDGKEVPVIEKNITLKVGLDVYDDLKKRYPNLDIVLTRHDDTYVSLEQRTQIANDVKLEPNEAMIFVSIHANASFDPNANGYEVWYLPPTYRRNLVDPNSLGDSTKELYPILNSMREEEYTIESVLLGKKILSDVHGAVGNGVVDRGLKEESWFVVRKAKMPAVLIELGFVTNKSEAVHLLEDQYLKKMATGIYNGISDFITYFDSTGGFTE